MIVPVAIASTSKIIHFYQKFTFLISTGGPIFGPEKYLEKFSISVEFASQMQFWSKVLLRIWTIIVHPNNFKVDQNCNLSDLDQKCTFEEKYTLFIYEVYDNMSKCSFGPLSDTNTQFWSRFGVRLWSKISTAKQV